MIEIGALWIKEGKNGKFMAGSLNGASLMVFKNDKKTQPNQPDYKVFIAENKNKNVNKEKPQQPKKEEDFL